MQRINRELINETESQTRTSDLPNLEDLEVRLPAAPHCQWVRHIFAPYQSSSCLPSGRSSTTAWHMISAFSATLRPPEMLSPVSTINCETYNLRLWIRKSSSHISYRATLSKLDNLAVSFKECVSLIDSKAGIECRSCRQRSVVRGAFKGLREDSDERLRSLVWSIILPHSDGRSTITRQPDHSVLGSYLTVVLLSQCAIYNFVKMYRAIKARLGYASAT